MNAAKDNPSSENVNQIWLMLAFPPAGPPLRLEDWARLNRLGMAACRPG
jgi:hypothetical protein